jgi:asparagine synthase (glutamine-hydrolysing)
MCGIAGIYSGIPGEVTPDLLKCMTRTIRHRGPDDEGYLLVDTSSGTSEPRSGDDTSLDFRTMNHISAPTQFQADLGLGHRRLSIIDLSSAGHQPMCNEEGNVWIIHNGEIYNHAALREELKQRGHKFNSRTDTEVVLHSYEEWGAECLKRFNGMWAFAIWDGRHHKLFCSRDRFGVKPFYYYHDAHRFIFASEIKALLQADFVSNQPNNQTIFDYLAYNIQDCTEDTFFSSVKKLPGGHYLELSLPHKKLKIERYYEIPLHPASKMLSNGEYASNFLHLFEDSIRLRLISDVPLGICLSGGLDSSSIVCATDNIIKASAIPNPATNNLLKTFSARYTEPGYDEGRFIVDVLTQTNAQAHNVYPSAKSMWNNLPEVIWHQDEPCTRSYVCAQWEVYQLARRSGVKIGLDGQGGDELLAGYDIYYSALLSSLLRKFKWHQAASESFWNVRLNGKSAYKDYAIAVYHLLPKPVQNRLRSLIHADGSTCLNTDFAAAHSGYFFQQTQADPAAKDFFDNYMRERFTRSILPGLLRDLDKNSMAHSIESRPPFLDFRLVESVYSMPWEQKIKHGVRKVVLRNAMKGILPDSLVNRYDKMGFPTPVDVWLRGGMGEPVRDIFESSSFKTRGYLDIQKEEREFAAHLGGGKRIGSYIWRWINLELWLRMFVDHRPSFP